MELLNEIVYQVFIATRAESKFIIIMNTESSNS